MIAKEKIDALAVEELQDANRKYMLFSSPHEAFAVLCEEMEELNESVRDVATFVNRMWADVREDLSIEEDAVHIDEYTTFVIQEALQVKAMAKKVKQSELYNEKKSR